MMDYIKFLLDLRRFGMKLGLENITALLNHLGNPQERFLSVHIAGTNGKGSTAAILESILRAAGYRTGLYTSPHLVDMRERIRVNGEMISPSQMAHFTQILKPQLERLEGTFFEAMTAIAFAHFAQEGVEVAVIETGLGGRLDATNVISPLLSIITEIDLDHTQHLGTTKSQIAGEKAGIIKEGVKCIVVPRDPEVLSVIRNVCREKNAELIPLEDNVEVTNLVLKEDGTLFSLKTLSREYKDLTLPLPGRHQIQNASAAVLASELLWGQGFKVQEKDVRRGLAEVHWPGRLQLVRREPKVLLDVAHNPNGMRALVQALSEIYEFQRLILIMGVLETKDYVGMLKEIMPLCAVGIATRLKSPRALNPEALVAEMNKYSAEVRVCEDAVEGLSLALKAAHKEDLICVTGSHYTVGEILKKS